MKWIKYQIEQGEIDGEAILITKKVGHSEANLAIALEEAYNGEYEIIEDDTELPKNEFGLIFRGTNPLSSSDEDTPSFWDSLGSGVWDFTGTVKLTGLTTSESRGTLMNFITTITDQITQIFVSGSTVCYRNGSVSGDYWSASGVYDTKAPWKVFTTEERTKVVTGRYMGSGMYGASLPNKINITGKNDFKFAIIHNEDRCLTMMLFGNNSFYPEYSETYWKDDYTTDAITYVKIYSRWGFEDKKLVIEWYNADSAFNQFNNQGDTYSYMVW